MANVTIASSSETDGSNVFTKPTGLVDGDVLVLRYWWFDDTSTAGLPTLTGFTRVVADSISTPTFGDFIFGRAIFRKVITNAAGEPADYTVTRVGNAYDGGEIDRLSNVDTSTPETDSGSATGTTGTISTGAAVDSGAEDLLLMDGICFSPATSMTTPTSMTQDYEQDGGDAEGWSQNAGVLSGATKTSTLDNSSEWCVVWAVFKAATPPPSYIMLRGTR